MSENFDENYLSEVHHLDIFIKPEETQKTYDINFDVETIKNQKIYISEPFTENTQNTKINIPNFVSKNKIIEFEGQKL